MTWEHLRPLLDEVRAMQQLFKLGENFARGQVPPAVVNMVRCGRMTALAKPDGGVRGIVSGDVLRRLVARTMAQQLGPAVKAAAAPHQYALSTRAGCECIAHALQGLCELNPRMTITSIDGVGAYDLISRKAMLTGLQGVDGGNSSLPFVRVFYGSPSEYLWEGDFGETHSIPPGEGGGDAMMPLFCSVGWHTGVCRTGSTAWHSWMVHTWRLTQTAWVLCKQTLCGRRQASGSTPRCGTRRAFDLRLGESGPGTESIGPSVAVRRDPRRAARDQNLGNPTRPPIIRPKVLELPL